MVVGLKDLKEYRTLILGLIQFFSYIDTPIITMYTILQTKLEIREAERDQAYLAYTLANAELKTAQDNLSAARVIEGMEEAEMGSAFVSAFKQRVGITNDDRPRVDLIQHYLKYSNTHSEAMVKQEIITSAVRAFEKGERVETCRYCVSKEPRLK